MKVIHFNKLKKPLLIAEIGNNHEGNINNAIKLIESAHKAGADVVKFQHIVPEKLYHSSEIKRIKFLRKVCLKLTDFKKLAANEKKKKLLFSVTPFDINSVKYLKKFVDIFKIASSDNNYFSLINKVIATNKPLVISTGLSNILEINKLYKHVKKKSKNLNKICFLHCVSNYPTKYKDVNLGFIKTMKKKFNKISIGYSDHVPGVVASVLACSLKIKALEKHFTLDKKFSSFRDHELSADFRDLSIIREYIDNYEKILGNKNNTIKILADRNQIRSLRRTAYLNKKLIVNTKLKFDDIEFLRPRKFDNLNKFSKIYKLRSKKNLKLGSVLKLKNFY